MDVFWSVRFWHQESPEINDIYIKDIGGGGEVSIFLELHTNCEVLLLIFGGSPRKTVFKCWLHYLINVDKEIGICKM